MRGSEPARSCAQTNEDANHERRAAAGARDDVPSLHFQVVVHAHFSRPLSARQLRK